VLLRAANVKEPTERFYVLRSCAIGPGPSLEVKRFSAKRVFGELMGFSFWRQSRHVVVTRSLAHDLLDDAREMT
jgi:hypothetical protein